MKYYTSKGELVEYKTTTPKYFGTSAEIFPITKTLYLKKYYKDTPASARMNEETFQILKNLNHPFTNRVLELLCEEEKKKEKQDFFQNPNIYQTDAYLYEFLPSEKINLIRQKKDYLFYNLRALEELIVLIFSELKIIAKDLKQENVVFYKDKIVLIDLDNCKLLSSKMTEWLREQNKEALIRLFKTLTMRKWMSSPVYNERVNQLFSLETDEPFSTQLERKLRKSKTIEEFLKGK